MKEAKERDYKAEYKKFQSSTKAKKYRAELNKYNRKKGTYGNGDGKDASHKGGKIVGFESQSKNRGRAEKSRLKKEGNIGITTKKGKSIYLTHKTSGKEIVVVNTPSVLKKYKKLGYLISMPEGKLNEAKFKDIDVKKLGKKKTNDLMKYLFNIDDLGLKTDMKTDTKKKILSVNISKISPKVAQNIQKRFGVDLTEGKLEEKAKRDYKTEYKKYGSSKKSKKYRAELNKYNRQKGTYGNGDKKDASHKGGKIVGFE